MKVKKYKEIKHHLTGWLQCYQLNEVFKIDKKKGFAMEESKVDKELIQNEIQ